LFVCLFAGLRTNKTTKPIFTKFGRKVAHEPREKPLDFCGNPDHITLGIRGWVRVAVRWGQTIPLDIEFVDCEIIGLDGGMRSSHCHSPAIRRLSVDWLTAR